MILRLGTSPGDKTGPHRTRRTSSRTSRRTTTFGWNTCRDTLPEPHIRRSRCTPFRRRRGSTRRSHLRNGSRRSEARTHSDRARNPYQRRMSRNRCRTARHTSIPRSRSCRDTRRARRTHRSPIERSRSDMGIVRRTRHSNKRSGRNSAAHTYIVRRGSSARVHNRRHTLPPPVR